MFAPSSIVRRRIVVTFGALVVGLSLATASGVRTVDSAKPNRGFSYLHDEVPEVPWSIHVFKFDRSRSDFGFRTTLGNSNVLGMSTVSEQVRRLGQENDLPLAAINGDFYNNSDPSYPGDPRDLQIHQGELVSAPSGHACLWIDPSGAPQMTNVVSQFRVVWPDGTTNGFGLNEPRDDDALVLYTSALGNSSRTAEGLDLVLENASETPWLPLKIGETYRARVKSVHRGGNAPIDPSTCVLSIGPLLVDRLPKLKVGDGMQLITESAPCLRGVQTAIGGGPTLVRGGRALEWTGLQVRHPRSAVGWNSESFFLVEVDGRQGNVSVGMTFTELAKYMVKLGCDQAMNLDGGGSATLWVMGNVMSSPSEGHERPGANSLVIVQKRSGTTR